jgi:hypothetical protein
MAATERVQELRAQLDRYKAEQAALLSSIGAIVQQAVAVRATFRKRASRMRLLQ